MRALILTLLLATTACTAPVQQALQRPVPVAAVQDVQTALASYQAALGIAQVALITQPALLARVNALAAKAAPYVAAVQAGTADAAAAPTLRDVAVDLLMAGKDYIQAIPNAVAAR